MSAAYGSQSQESRAPRGRARSGRIDDAELLAPPAAEPVQLSRGMFSQPAPRPAPAPLTNHHLKKVARMDEAAIAADGGGDGGDGGGSGGSGGGGGRAPRARSARSARSAAASSVRGGRKAFSAVSDEEVIDVDGEPTTLADEDMDPRHAPADEDLPGANGPNGYPNDNDRYANGNGYPNGYPSGYPNGAGASGIAGLAAGEGGVPDEGPDPLEELEADTPAVRLAEVNADLEAEVQGRKDPWVMVHLAQLALGHAKVVWRTMPVAVREEPLLLAKAHYGPGAGVTDMGVVALMAQCHGLTAEARLRAAEDEKADRASALRSAEECVSRQDRRSDRGDPFYSPEQIDRYKLQEQTYSGGGAAATAAAASARSVSGGSGGGAAAPSSVRASMEELADGSAPSPSAYGGSVAPSVLSGGSGGGALRLPSISSRHRLEPMDL
ncbi:hypothetical protein GPECTOR_15g382 [Gonium pectorale]|uniref:Uncharacterized protein n=1 Tax=Gonium pectorale TaxID=33097 RepID=A0A150GLP1_GONPE|nr:hypothetical protein GPECTOR_15g382 [Gonium pectorale]|eukprot:KXZ50698.1 hypothetical protein GPECTOR_15g382 [Gonium pectorale]